MQGREDEKTYLGQRNLCVVYQAELTPLIRSGSELYF